MDAERRKWNDALKEFRESLKGWNEKRIRKDILKYLHAAVHEPGTGDSGIHSFFNEMIENLPEEAFSRIPEKEKHSYAYHIWHTTRIEDINMIYVISGLPQVLDSGGWLSKLGVEIRHTGNTLNREEVLEFGTKIDIRALLAYRRNVASETQRIIDEMNPLDLKTRVNPDVFEKLLDDEDVLPDASWLIDYWKKKDYAGLFLMPATRHHFLHINEAIKYKKKII